MKTLSMECQIQASVSEGNSTLGCGKMQRMFFSCTHLPIQTALRKIGGSAEVLAHSCIQNFVQVGRLSFESLTGYFHACSCPRIRVYLRSLQHQRASRRLWNVEIILLFCTIESILFFLNMKSKSNFHHRLRD